jgi:t-SNARE complex subunit (syntaxin)
MKNEAYQQIEKDVVHLQESMDILHGLVHAQQDHLDTIEDMIHLTKENAEKGETELKDASLNYKSYIQYVAVGMVTLLYFIF